MMSNSIVYEFSFVLVVLFYITFRRLSGSYHYGYPNRDYVRDFAQPFLESNYDELPEARSKRDVKMIIFHAFMTLTSVSMSMFLTNFGAPSFGGADYYDPKLGSFIV
jgi:hypothetical protein